MISVSQVPQPTCYRKWVGCTIPLKQEFFTLEASWAFNMARTHERVELLEWSGYLKPLFNWRTLHTCIGCNATAAWRAPPIWKFGTANICTRICQFFNCISQFWWWHLLPRHLGQPVWCCLRISLIKIVPKMNFNCICNDLATGFVTFSTVFLNSGVGIYCLASWSNQCDVVYAFLWSK